MDFTNWHGALNIREIRVIRGKECGQNKFFNPFLAEKKL